MSLVQCNHLSWLQIFGDAKSGFSVIYDDRYKRIVGELAAPSKQCPSLAFFLGNKARDTALKHLFPNNNVRRPRTTPLAINLRIDNGSSTTDNPILFADCDPLQCTWPSQDNHQAPCHEQKHFPLPWGLSHQADVLDVLLARLFFSFTDVICIFAEDVGGLDAVGNLLVKWAGLGRPSSLPDSVRPQVLVVTQGDGSASVTHSLLKWDDFRYHILQTEKVDLTQSFAAIKVVQLADEHLSPLVRYRGLKDVVCKALDEARRLRAFNTTLFSAVHQAALFQNALRHVAQTIREPFDILNSTRKDNRIQADYSTHLEQFFSLTTKLKLPYDSIAYYVASTILVDAYPPKMHRK
jgi:hypothetical protein